MATEQIDATLQARTVLYLFALLSKPTPCISQGGGVQHLVIIGHYNILKQMDIFFKTIFLSTVMYDSTTIKGKKSLSKKKNSPHLGSWLAVDDENKEVRYRVDPSWLKNATEEEQKSAFSQLSALVDAYRRAGYAIIDIPKT